MSSRPTERIEELPVPSGLPPCVVTSGSPGSSARIGAYSIAQYGRLLAGMMARGHGLDAICFFLTLGASVVLDLVIECGLSRPSDRPLRRCGGARSWTEADYTLLLEGWVGLWTAACIADRLGRSRGAIWAKARRLGLPKRDRRSLIYYRATPPASAVDVPQATASVADTHFEIDAPSVLLAGVPATDQGAAVESVAIDSALPSAIIKSDAHIPATSDVVFQADVATGVEAPVAAAAMATEIKASWYVQGTNHPVLVQWRRPGIEIEWTPELSEELAMRKWANQKNTAIARDFGIAIRAITSHLYWLQIPKQRRSTATETYDPERARKNIEESGYTTAKCIANNRYSYWRHRRYRECSRRDVAAGLYATA